MNTLPKHSFTNACIGFLLAAGAAIILPEMLMAQAENALITSVIVSVQSKCHNEQQHHATHCALIATQNDTNIAATEDSSFSPTAYTPANIDRTTLKQHLEYPAEAIAQHIEGRVDVIIYLNNKGEPTTVNFESMSPLDAYAATILASAACKAIQHSTFTPATLTIAGKTKPVSSVVRMPFKFVL
jgi:TonB family protein